MSARHSRVGTARTEAGTEHAFLWEDGVMNDLNDLLAPDSGWTLAIAFGIDQQGRIVGQGIHDGQRPRSYSRLPTAIDERAAHADPKVVPSVVG